MAEHETEEETPSKPVQWQVFNNDSVDPMSQEHFESNRKIIKRDEGRQFDVLLEIPDKFLMWRWRGGIWAGEITIYMRVE